MGIPRACLLRLLRRFHLGTLTLTKLELSNVKVPPQIPTADTDSAYALTKSLITNQWPANFTCHPTKDPPFHI